VLRLPRAGRLASLPLLLLPLACAGGGAETAPMPAATFELDARLPVDANGLYHLDLVTRRGQTIHRISGHVTYAGAPKHDGQTASEAIPVGWRSSHFWIINDSMVIVVQRLCPHQTDVLCIYELFRHPPLDTLVLSQFTGLEVPTVNGFSYSAADGEVNTIFAPVGWMSGDTVEITAQAQFPSGEVLERSLRIVLEWPVGRW